MSSPASIHYFGYGSLVNRNTRPPCEVAINVTLKGWRRVWNHRATGETVREACTSLSIEPYEGEIRGVLVKIPVSDLEVLDQREYGYERLALDASNFDVPSSVEGGTIYAYRSLQENRHLASLKHPIMQSYVDVVMAGYLSRFGEDGLMQLMNSTRGWDLPIHNDRQQPTYPRSVSLSVDQHQHFDRLLAALR